MMENKFAQNVVKLFIKAIVGDTQLIISDIEPGHKEDVRINFVSGDFLHIQYVEDEGEFHLAYRPNPEVFGEFRTSRLTLPEEFFGYINVAGDQESKMQLVGEGTPLAKELALGVFNRLKWTSQCA